MRTVRTVVELRSSLLPARRQGLASGSSTGPSPTPRSGSSTGQSPTPTSASSATIGLVPTMGALHEGHLSLIRGARERCDRVVVSLFVNPAQFDEHGDLAGYPRREREDATLAAEAGADVLFAPSIEEIYPPGFATTVEVLGLTDRLEGLARGSQHFRGVTTVVTKLLCMVMPDVAFFGQKDAQQLVVIRRLVADLNLPVQIEALPTVRDPDGLALSSRNALLDPSERARALGLYSALSAARELAASGTRSAEALLATAHERLHEFGIVPDYLELVDPATLEPLRALEGEALLAVAARIGAVRLIDNLTLAPAPSASPSTHSLPGEAIATCNA